MPLYDYKCQDCGHEFEALQSMKDDPLTTCPVCENESLKKMVSAPAFSFKGGGWYKDLYGSAGASDKSSDSSKSSSGSDTKTTSSTKSDSSTSKSDSGKSKSSASSSKKD